MATKMVRKDITDADVDALQNALDTMKTEAKNANDAGSLVAFNIWYRMIKIASAEVRKANERKEREELARMNKAKEALRTGAPSATSNTP